MPVLARIRHQGLGRSARRNESHRGDHGAEAANALIAGGRLAADLSGCIRRRRGRRGAVSCHHDPDARRGRRLRGGDHLHANGTTSASHAPPRAVFSVEVQRPNWSGGVFGSTWGRKFMFPFRSLPSTMTQGYQDSQRVDSLCVPPVFAKPRRVRE